MVALPDCGDVIGRPDYEFRDPMVAARCLRDGGLAGEVLLLGWDDADVATCSSGWKGRRRAVALSQSIAQSDRHCTVPTWRAVSDPGLSGFSGVTVSPQVGWPSTTLNRPRSSLRVPQWTET